MHRFFAFFSCTASLLYLASLLLGPFRAGLGLGVTHHILLGLTAAITTVAVHCLIFGIFTGSGKDTKELVKNYQLNPEFVARTKQFKRAIFPKALYAIVVVLFVAFFGGSIVIFDGHTLVRLSHLLLGWLGWLYNIRVFVLEYRVIRENRELIQSVNSTVGLKTGLVSDSNELTMDSRSHVWAMGNFSVFLGINVWLPYIYLRFVMSITELWLWPFLLSSGVLILGGYYLKWRYRKYRPFLKQAVY